jgi:putative ABC transport system substrate-binding protein
MKIQFSILDFGFSIGSRANKFLCGFHPKPFSDNRKSKIENPKWGALLAIMLVLLFGWARAEGQQSRKVYRIGYLANATGIASREEAFRQGLRELGYVEGQNLVIEWRFSKGQADRLQDLAGELVRLKVDLILAMGVAAARFAKEATGTIPIVMGNADDDPVRHGLVASLARPGGNVTGFTNIGSALAGKRLELLKETVPKVSRVAILWDSRGPGGAGHARETTIAAPALGVQLQPVEVQGADELENAFQTATKARAEALIVVHTGLMQTQRTRVVSLALKTRLPVMYTDSSFANAGGLMSYSDDDLDRSRRAASYADRILKGLKPAELPVQQPTKFELVINLKTAKQIGLTIPPNVLARADKVIR